tara:strand:+ start:467 stop:646 length:180 start_codon:yes stop_codon:yes gene_type:complete
MIITESFILAVLGLIGGAGSAFLIYFLKSRCKTIKCCCVECERDVLPHVEATLHRENKV